MLKLTDALEDLEISIGLLYPAMFDGDEALDFEDIEAMLTVYRATRPIDNGIMRLVTSRHIPMDFWAFDDVSADMGELFSTVLYRLGEFDRKRVQASPFIYVHWVEIAPKWRGKGLGTCFVGNVLHRLGAEQSVVFMLPRLSEDGEGVPTETRGLTRFFAQFGFKSLWDTPFLYSAPWTFSGPARNVPPLDPAEEYRPDDDD